MDKIVVAHYNSDRSETVEKLGANQWILLSTGEPKTTTVVPIIDRKPAIRAAAWIETHKDVNHMPGLHYWGNLDASFSDDHGIGYINAGFKSGNGLSHLPVPNKGWALLRVRNDNWMLDVPRQQHIKAEDVDESPEMWTAKMDYVDGLTKGIGFFIYTGNPEHKTDLTFYIRQVLSNMELPASEQQVEKQHRIIGGQMRKSVYQITKELTRRNMESLPTSLPVDNPNPAPQTPMHTCIAVDRKGKKFVIDLEKIAHDVQFTLKENGKPVSGYKLYYTNNPDPIYLGARKNAFQYAKSTRYEFEIDIVEKDWVVKEL